MATTFKLKRKLYSDDEKKGMGTGTKLALGAATLAGGFYGARKGMFGNTARLGANKMYMSAGKALGSKGMVKSGAKDYATASVNLRENSMAKLRKNNDFKFTDAQRNSRIDSLQKKMENKYAPTVKQTSTN